jgi:5'-3' exonuclease
VVQVDRKSNKIRDAAAVRDKFGVAPELIADYLALVGDSADGYPGIAGIGSKTAARLLNRHGPIEQFPPEVLGEQQAGALLFKQLATLRSDAPLFVEVGMLRWQGPTDAFAPLAAQLGDARLLARCTKAWARLGASGLELSGEADQ